MTVKIGSLKFKVNSKRQTRVLNRSRGLKAVLCDVMPGCQYPCWSYHLVKVIEVESKKEVL